MDLSLEHSHAAPGLFVSLSTLKIIVPEEILIGRTGI